MEDNLKKEIKLKIEHHRKCRDVLRAAAIVCVAAWICRVGIDYDSMEYSERLVPSLITGGWVASGVIAWLFSLHHNNDMEFKQKQLERLEKN